jgi:precorrin-3B synthase
MPIGTVPLDAFAGLCAAARCCGNGVIEITSRGSVQVRGLSAASAGSFATAIGALDIEIAEGIVVATNPLAGLDAEEIFDSSGLAAELRDALERRALAARVGAKVSIAIDSGGTLNLDSLTADVRLCADPNRNLRVAVGGDAARAIQLGHIAAKDGVEAVTRLLEVVAARGGDVRARDVVAADGATVFQAAIADLLQTPAWEVESVHRSADAIGAHQLRDGSIACGVGLPFGHADAAVLNQLIGAARATSARGVRPAPGRVLIVIGLTQAATQAFATAAERLGFIVRADDPRRHVVACAGAPICASAHIGARELAPLLAKSVAAQLDGSLTLHISGCAKGCAHPAPAELTIVGTPEGCALVVGGTARDTPRAVVPANELPAAVADMLRKRCEADHV